MSDPGRYLVIVDSRRSARPNGAPRLISRAYGGRLPRVARKPASSIGPAQEPGCPVLPGRILSHWMTIFDEATGAFFGSSSVSTPSTYFACTFVSSTSWPRLNVRETDP